MQTSSLLSLAAFVVALSACEASSASRADQAPGPAPAITAMQPALLTRVTDRSSVCMVNNQYMGKAQIPVVVDGKTYFGCCAMCKEKLANGEAVRQATDPVSGKTVDKASAIIGRDADGKVFYFDSEATFERYHPAAP